MAKLTHEPVNTTLRNYILISLIGLLIIISLYNIRHHYYLIDLDKHEYFTSESYQEPIFPKLTQQQVLNLGWAHVDPKSLTGPFSKHQPPRSSYTHFSESKIHNVVRIGIFGDSFVWGDEAAYGFDFPTLLQGLFAQAGHNYVEVLNFGVAGYGLHQTFLMWEYLGKKYDLDYSIFLPFDFHMRRDLTFNRHLNRYCPIHARYIVTQTGLALSPVMGNSRKAACSLYHRLLTSWPYLRYDRNPPTFLRILLPKGRQFKFNPFYYSNMNRTEEALTTYKILFNRLATEANHPIVLCHHKEICALQESLPDNIYFHESRINQIFAKPLPELYAAPKSHLSALGNEARAQGIFSLLTAQSPSKSKVMTFASRPDSTKAAFESLPSLAHFAQVRVGIQGHHAADFVSRKDGAAAWMFENDIDFKRDAIASLLWVLSKKGLEFIPFSFPLVSSETVFARLESDNQVLRVPIGQIEAGSSIIGKLRLTCGEWVSVSEHHNWQIKCEENSLNSLRIKGTGELPSVQIEVGKAARLLMKQEKTDGLQRFKNTIKNVFNMELQLTISLTPIIAPVAHLRAKAGSLTLNESQIQNVGTLDILLQSKDDQAHSVPILPYQFVKVSPPPSHSVYPYPIH